MSGRRAIDGCAQHALQLRAYSASICCVMMPLVQPLRMLRLRAKILMTGTSAPRGYMRAATILMLDFHMILMLHRFRRRFSFTLPRYYLPLLMFSITAHARHYATLAVIADAAVAMLTTPLRRASLRHADDGKATMPTFSLPPLCLLSYAIERR